MKKNSLIYSVIMLAGMMVFSTSCQDEELNPYIEPLAGVHAFGQFAEGSSSNFILGELGEDLTFNLRWVSIDNQISVEKIDLYILFNEDYEDVDRNPRVARHGGDEGRFFTSIEGGDLPANREDFTFSISQQDVRELYQGITFDYDEDGTAVDVFDNDFKPSRAAGAPFISGDNFAVRWVLTSTDGLVYDSWSPSVCTELPGANCEINWILECGQVIRQPAQDYTITMADSFGDGWNGASLNVVADGTTTSVSVTEAEGAADTEVVSVPEGTSSVTFEYVSGDWDSEVSFTITTEKGNIIASVTNPSAGAITLNLCDENN